MEYERRQYLDELTRKKDNGRVKVVTGLRRCVMCSNTLC